MPRKLRELRTDLQRNGWRIDRQKGSHQTWEHSLVPDLSVVLAGKDGDDAQPYQVRKVRDAIRRSRAAEAARNRQQKGQQP